MVSLHSFALAWIETLDSTRLHMVHWHCNLRRSPGNVLRPLLSVETYLLVQTPSFGFVTLQITYLSRIRTGSVSILTPDFNLNLSHLDSKPSKNYNTEKNTHDVFVVILVIFLVKGRDILVWYNSCIFLTR